MTDLQGRNSENMAVAQADKRALSKLLVGLVFCTVLTGFAAITVTSVATSASHGANGYETAQISSAVPAK